MCADDRKFLNSRVWPSVNRVCFSRLLSLTRCVVAGFACPILICVRPLFSCVCLECTVPRINPYVCIGLTGFSRPPFSSSVFPWRMTAIHRLPNFSSATVLATRVCFKSITCLYVIKCMDKLHTNTYHFFPMSKFFTLKKT